MEYITKNSKFWSDDDDQVLRAIREGFIETQKAMWADLPKWRKTASGLPSTAGTTASICFIKRGKLFIGHVGDSGIMLGERVENSHDENSKRWVAKRLTHDHKPECEPELSRIQDAGGKVVSKSGVPRVVWYRPSGGHQGPVRRSTHIDEVWNCNQSHENFRENDFYGKCQKLCIYIVLLLFPSSQSLC